MRTTPTARRSAATTSPPRPAGPAPLIVLAALVLAAPALVGLGGCQSSSAANTYGDGSASTAARRTISAEAPWTSGSAIRATTKNGSISVRRAEDAAPMARIEARVFSPSQERVDAAELLAARGPDGVFAVSIHWPGGQPEPREGAAITILVPEAQGLTITTSNGTIEAVGLAGPAVLRTSNAAITVNQHAGDIDAHAGNGSITIGDGHGTTHARTSNAGISVLARTGPVTAVTGNGRIAITNCHGPIEARTSNAGVEIIDATGPVRVDTGNGRVGVRLAEANPGPVRIATSNAAVQLTVGPAFAGLLTMSTSNGAIQTHLPGIAVEQLTDAGGAKRFRLAGVDTPESIITTGNGSIGVRRR